MNGLQLTIGNHECTRESGAIDLIYKHAPAGTISWNIEPNDKDIVWLAGDAINTHGIVTEATKILIEHLVQVYRYSMFATKVRPTDVAGLAFAESVGMGFSHLAGDDVIMVGTREVPTGLDTAPVG